MFIDRFKKLSLLYVLAAIPMLLVSFAAPAHSAEGPSKEKVKVLYHVDGKDPEVAKYALALINKHIEAEGGPEHIDVELVVHGPALELFERDKMDPEMTKRFNQIIEKGAHARNVPGLNEDVRQDAGQLSERVCRHIASGGSQAHRRLTEGRLPVH